MKVASKILAAWMALTIVTIPDARVPANTVQPSAPQSPNTPVAVPAPFATVSGVKMTSAIALPRKSGQTLMLPFTVSINTQVTGKTPAKVSYSLSQTGFDSPVTISESTSPVSFSGKTESVTVLVRVGPPKTTPAKGATLMLTLTGTNGVVALHSPSSFSYPLD